MGVQNSLCHWILDFLQHEHKLSKSITSCHRPNTLALVPPWGVHYHLCYTVCYILCTHSVYILHTVKMLKFAVDTTLIGLISEDDDIAYRNKVLSLPEWCSHHNLDLNIKNKN